MSDYVITDGADRLADRLMRIRQHGPERLQKEIVRITLLSKAEIVNKITNDIEPHSGMHRKHNPQPVVTDLVDTGAYRASWQESFPGPYEGKVSTSIAYALPLEYGTEKMPGFYVARDTARKMREVFVKNLKVAIKELMS